MSTSTSTSTSASASQMTSKMSTAYSGLSALIQAATSQLGDLAETDTFETNSLVGSPPMLSNPTTPTLENTQLLELDDGTSSSTSLHVAATVTPLVTSICDQQEPVPATETETETETARTKSELCFPETLMVLLLNPEHEDVVTFLPDGKYFAIRRVDFTNQLLHKHFHLTCFGEFLDVAKGWGFVRVNGNLNRGGSNHSNNDGISRDAGESSATRAKHKKNINNSKADIYVFRRSHFDKNRPVDLTKIKFQNETGDSCPGGKAAPQTTHTNTTKSGSGKNNSTTKKKREHSELHANRDSGRNHRQRLRRKSKTVPQVVEHHPLSFPVASSDQPADQLRRRSSLELRGVAQAITSSKMYLSNGSDVIQDDDCHHHTKYSSIMDTADGSSSSGSGLDHIVAPQLERQSTSSSLVDGGVETATHTIVTDAIEALLFDETHTRETYNRHEKELSVSSLPGVVPISKQLFSVSDNNGASSDTTPNENNEGGVTTETTRNPTRETDTDRPTQEPSSSPWSEGKANIGSLEDASKTADEKVPSSPSLLKCGKLRVVIPRHSDEPLPQRDSVYGSMVVSPARMEAAAALVSQSRIRKQGI